MPRAQLGADGGSGLDRGLGVTGVRGDLGGVPGRPAAGSQTTWSAIGTTSTGTVTDPWSVATVTLSPSAAPASAAVAADIRATDRAGRARQGRLAVLHPAAVQQLVPGGQLYAQHAGPGASE